jgi:hypothetical protein
MKTFSLVVKCDNESQLHEALIFAAACIEDNPGQYDAMAVDEADEQLTEPESMLHRIE